MPRKKILRDKDSDIKFDRAGRMLYHPEFHSKRKKPYTEAELEYLCKFYDYDGLKSIALALDRLEAGVNSKVQTLKKEGKFEYYKSLNKYWLLGGDEKVNNLFHIYECEDCILTFAVEQVFEDQSEVKCPVCAGETLRDVAAGEMIIKER